MKAWKSWGKVEKSLGRVLEGAVKAPEVLRELYKALEKFLKVSECLPGAVKVWERLRPNCIDCSRQSSSALPRVSNWFRRFSDFVQGVEMRIGLLDGWSIITYGKTI